MRMIVVQGVVRVGAELRRKVLGAHGAIACMAIAVEPGPIAREWLSLRGNLGIDFRVAGAAAGAGDAAA